MRQPAIKWFEIGGSFRELIKGSPDNLEVDCLLPAVLASHHREWELRSGAGAVAGQLLHGYVGAPDVISSALEAAELRFRLPSHKLDSPIRTKPEEIPHEFSDHSDWRPQVFPGYF